MRKISEQMLNAIRSRKNWHKDNTAVVCINNTHSKVLLHNNHIATVVYDNMGGHRVIVRTDTFAQWPTRTTTERLRAMGCNVCVRKGVAHVDGEAVSL